MIHHKGDIRYIFKQLTKLNHYTHLVLTNCNCHFTKGFCYLGNFTMGKNMLAPNMASFADSNQCNSQFKSKTSDDGLRHLKLEFWKELLGCDSTYIMIQNLLRTAPNKSNILSLSFLALCIWALNAAVHSDSCMKKDWVANPAVGKAVCIQGRGGRCERSATFTSTAIHAAH